MAIANDTFVETSDTVLSSHTPTGPGAGASWAVQIAGAGISVIGSSDRCENTSSNNGNRYYCTTNLGSDQMVVQGDFTLVSNTALQAFGPMGRVPTDGVNVGVEFIWDTANNRWEVSDGVSNNRLNDTWPGGTVTMRLVIANGVMKGFVDGVLKVSLTSDLLAGNTLAGFRLGDFSGGAANTIACDNYISVGPANTRIYLPSTGAAAVTPLAPVGWSETTGFDILRCTINRISSAMTNKQRVTSLTAANVKILLRQYVSDPIASQTIPAGFVIGTVRALESAINDNIDAVTSHIWVSSNDGQTNRGDILAIGNYGPVAEFNTSLRAKRIADGDTTTQVVALTGDRIIIEVGYTTTVGGTSLSGSLNFGDNGSVDLGNNETETGANNPFVDFSFYISFQPSPGAININQSIKRASYY